MKKLIFLSIALMMSSTSLNCFLQPQASKKVTYPFPVTKESCAKIEQPSSYQMGIQGGFDDPTPAKMQATLEFTKKCKAAGHKVGYADSPLGGVRGLTIRGW